ncbi:MAG: hypothetical protein HQM14_10480 [SAR324 cluster bacterium]|nr:hypothetical protein [SAR324 cluster bacterium]
MKKKPLHSENSEQQVGIAVEPSKEKNTSFACSNTMNAEANETIVPVLSTGTENKKAQKNPGDIEIVHDDALVIQITASTAQIKESFNTVTLSEDEIEMAIPRSDLMAVNPFHFIGLGRNQKSQGTMVMANMVGIAKKQGKIIVSH